ncbi:Eco57I restriction-modification methylase domain-containing protein [Confluentibacter flavum]|uniref:site-specific DNA-methyltransferase (adenine-specific) n=1 Tax=Confluentibacter flavum TaxID=1909700 RepID=A0A2N3HQ07_9FLAO|nr:TaqI-like C-terminal specificity domain-containing protein [Confluentibacter flavum]PKQ47004.1 hypothetical protein CSW08_00100 [Confluentibacter flavum]
MAFFQNSVLNKHLNAQDADAVKTAYQKFTAYFHNPAIQQNIRDAKEEQFQEGFLRELFVDILGYTLNPQPNFNLTTELKNEKGAKKADGAILTRGQDPLSIPKALAVIELKGTDTKDLDKINVQAFNYKNNQTGCVYVITSNFEKLRFFIHHSVEHLEFNLFTLSESEFKILWLCLRADNLLSGVPLKVKEESLLEEEKITKQLYKDYAAFRNDLWQNMVKNSSAKDKLLLFKKTQKLLDRYLFIFFAEDSGLLPPNSISRIVTRWEILKQEDAYKPLYDIFKQYFGYIDTGRKGQKTVDDIFAYNGGLFQPDEVLDSIQLDDEILHPHVINLTRYDFQSEVDVNILGHIFENSLNEIESITAELEGQEIDKSKTKRKKDGVFYTPKYITKYIVDNTVGKLCEEKKAELGIIDEEYAKGRRNRKKEIIKSLDENLQAYRNWLLNITICDPACGSGAFLNQALEFLIEEHAYVDELQAQLFGASIVFQDVSNHILEKNIFGVDINEESVDIAKLSLWLRTAQRGRKLTTLNNNIKCGNSLIDDPSVAGEKAFNWQKEFPTVFQEKDKKPFHITWVTHNSRTSQRMIDHKVKKGDAFWLEDEQEVVVAKTIKEIVEQDGLNVMAFNSCGDHIHLLLVCEEEEIPNIVRKLKGKSSQQLKEHLQIPKEEQFTLWAQKYSTTYIDLEEQLWNTVAYIQNNRLKHQLHTYTDNKGLQPLVSITESDSMQQSYNHAFRTEYKGGFDVVIGNPPYVNIVNIEDVELRKHYQTSFSTFKNKCDLYSLFIERSFILSKQNGLLGFIFPNSWLGTSSFSRFREKISKDVSPLQLVELPPGVFTDAIVTTVIMTYRNMKPNIDHNVILFQLKNQMFFQMEHKISLKTVCSTDNYSYSLEPQINLKSGQFKLGDIVNFSLGIKTSDDKRFIFNYKKDDNSFPMLRGKDIGRYSKSFNGEYLWYMPELIKEKAGGRPRVLEHYLKPKILIQDIAKTINCTYDDELYLVNDTINVIHEVKSPFTIHAVIALLNSKLCGQWFSRQFPEGLHIKINQLQEIPLPEVSENNISELTTKCIDILKFHSQLNSNTTQYTDLLQSKFEIEKLTTKLQNWYELEFKDFLKELKKAKVQLSLPEEAEWMQYFKEQKQKAQALKTEIDRIDKNIDTMVYQLYNLKDEEIKIVEQS